MVEKVSDIKRIVKRDFFSALKKMKPEIEAAQRIHGTKIDPKAIKDVMMTQAADVSILFARVGGFPTDVIRKSFKGMEDKDIKDSCTRAFDLIENDEFAHALVQGLSQKLDINLDVDGMALH